MLTCATSNYIWVYVQHSHKQCYVFFCVFHTDQSFLTFSQLFTLYFCILSVTAKLSYKSSNIFSKIYFELYCFNVFLFVFKCHVVCVFLCAYNNTETFSIMPYLKWLPFHFYHPLNKTFLFLLVYYFTSFNFTKPLILWIILWSKSKYFPYIYLFLTFTIGFKKFVLFVEHSFFLLLE